MNYKIKMEEKCTQYIQLITKQNNKIDKKKSKIKNIKYEFNHKKNIIRRENNEILMERARDQHMRYETIKQKAR